MNLVGAMHGALVAMCLLAALFFVRYWYLCRDRFFVWFASAFATFAISWALTASALLASEHAAEIYGFRLLGFLQIIAAILFKNRKLERE